jgi:hypothetical protein
LPQLASDVRSGRYTDAVARGNRLLGAADLTRAQLATVHRMLVEAYVALDAQGLAETSCLAWREADPTAVLDPIELSPKIVRACTNAATSLGAAQPPPPASPAVSASPARAPDGGR